MKKNQILDFIHLMCLEKEGKIRHTPLCRGARTLWEVAKETEKY
ncbi:TPA: hypothetical protein N6Y02_003784 [Escherichia coli]|nr:hypothetical protein [Escherichia coli]